MSLWAKVRGTIETIFQIGLSGPQIKNNSGNVDVRNSADTGYVIVRGGTPVGDNDLTTKSYVDQISKPIPATLQFNGNNTLPTNSATEQWYVVTTTGPNATIGQLLWDDGSATGTVTVMPALNGRVIGIQSAFVGGTITFLADSLYMWDTSSWFNVSGSAVSGALRMIRLPVATAAATSSATQIPANAVIQTAILEVTTPYSAGATISLGISGTATLFMLTTDNLPQASGLYKVDQDTSVGGSAAALLVTIGATPAAGASNAIVFYSVANV